MISGDVGGLGNLGGSFGFGGLSFGGLGLGFGGNFGGGFPGFSGGAGIGGGMDIGGVFGPLAGNIGPGDGGLGSGISPHIGIDHGPSVIGYESDGTPIMNPGIGQSVPWTLDSTVGETPKRQGWLNAAGGVRGRDLFGDLSQAADGSLGATGRYTGGDSYRNPNGILSGDMFMGTGGTFDPNFAGPYRTPTAEMWDDPYWTEQDESGVAQRMYAYIFGADLDEGRDYSLQRDEDWHGRTQLTPTLGGADTDELGGALANDELMDPFAFQQQYDARRFDAGGGHAGYLPEGAFTEAQLANIATGFSGSEYGSSEEAFYGLNQQAVAEHTLWGTDAQPNSMNNLGPGPQTVSYEYPDFAHSEEETENYADTAVPGAPGLRAQHGKKPKKDISGRLITPTRRDQKGGPGRRGTRKASSGDSLLDYFGGGLLA